MTPSAEEESVAKDDHVHLCQICWGEFTCVRFAGAPLQFNSSSPPGQSASPSQAQVSEMQVPLAHWISSVVIFAIYTMVINANAAVVIFVIATVVIFVIATVVIFVIIFVWITLNWLMLQFLGWHPASSLPSPQSSSPSHWNIHR